jgi:ankyrin repeat protein
MLTQTKTKISRMNNTVFDSRFLSGYSLSIGTEVTFVKKTKEHAMCSLKAIHSIPILMSVLFSLGCQNPRQRLEQIRQLNSIDELYPSLESGSSQPIDVIANDDSVFLVARLWDEDSEFIRAFWTHAVVVANDTTPAGITLRPARVLYLFKSTEKGKCLAIVKSKQRIIEMGELHVSKERLLEEPAIPKGLIECQEVERQRDLNPNSKQLGGLIAVNLKNQIVPVWYGRSNFYVSEAVVGQGFTVTHRMVPKIVPIAFDARSGNAVSGDSVESQREDRLDLELVLYSNLLDAALHGNVREVHRLLQYNQPQALSQALWGSSLNGHSNVASVLLDSGATTEWTANDGTTALYVAAQNGHTEIVRILLKRGASVDSRRNDAQTPLMAAIQFGHGEIARLLLEYKGNYELKSEKGATAIGAAAECGHLDLLQLLLEYGATLNVRDVYGSTPIFMAAQEGHVDVVKFLISQGVQVDSKDDKNATPLMVAAFKGHSEIVRMLLAAGANPNVKARTGTTPLLSASFAGHVEIVKELLKAGADVNVTMGGKNPAEVTSTPEIRQMILTARGHK